MCPACMASAAMLVGSVVTTGGLTALAVRIFRLKKSDKASGPEKTSQRRTDHGNSDEQ
jgi:hypothetical protein